MQVSLPCDLIRSGYPVKVTTIDRFAHVGIRGRLSQSAPPRKKTHLPLPLGTGGGLRGRACHFRYGALWLFVVRGR